jgi:predicted dienelactone hydrolase
MKFRLGWRDRFGKSQQQNRNVFRSSQNYFPLLGSACTLFISLGCWFAPSTLAAERLTFRAGFFEKSIEISSLEDLVRTGEVPPDLKPYEFLLTPQIKQSLGKRLHVDSFLVEPFLADLFSSPDGKKLLEQLSKALPGSSPQRIKQTFKSALHQKDVLNVLSFLRAYPDANLRIDLAEVTKIAVQLNASAWQNQLISSRLEGDLRVETDKKFPLNFDPASRGNEAVSIVTFRLRDRARDRIIPVDVYSSDRTRGPLVVLSHGFAADRRFLNYLAYHLASHGLTVVALDHPGSNITALVQTAVGMNFKQLLPASEFIDRPQDISFLLDRLEVFNRRRGLLQGKFNTQQVTVIGHSFGSYTALALAGAELNPKALRDFCQAGTPLERSPADWLQCAGAELPYGKRQFKDPRVAQVIAFNPIIGNLFGNNLSGVKIPTLIVSSSDDGITPTISHQLQPFKQLSGEKYLLVAIGATHMSVTDISNLNSTVGQSTLVREVMADEAQPMRELANGISLAFIEQLTSKAKLYQPFLSSAYAQSFSNNTIAFRLVKELPLSLDTWLNVLNFGDRQFGLDEAEDKPSILKAIEEYFINAKQILSPPVSCTAQLDRVFTGLLNNYDRSWDELS